MKSSIRGFTLIELSVVVFIILILAAISIPVIGGALSRAKMTQCGSQLKELGTCMLQYTDTAMRRGAFPSNDDMDEAGGWANLPEVNEYFDIGSDDESPAKRTIFYCPMALKVHPSLETLKNTSYGFNENLIDERLFNVTQGDKTILLGDGFYEEGDNTTLIGDTRLPEALHKRGGKMGAQFFFVDGHVDFIPKAVYETASGAILWKIED